VLDFVMPGGGAIVFGDLLGKFEVLRVVRRLIEQHGRDGKVTDWLAPIAERPMPCALPLTCRRWLASYPICARLRPS
jgi:hypothetical protein